MNHLRQICAIAILTIVLAFSVYAGDMHTPGITPPPPPPPSESVAGEIGTPGASVTSSSSNAAADSVLEIALDLMQGVLSLF